MAQTVIFAAIHFMSAKQAQRICDVLEGRPNLGRLVQSVSRLGPSRLVFGLKDEDRDGARELAARVLKMCTRARRYACSLGPLDEPAFPSGAIMLPESVREIELHGGTDVKTLLDLTTFASPETLTLVGGQAMHPIRAYHLGDVSRSMSELRRLKLDWNYDDPWPTSLEEATEEALAAEAAVDTQSVGIWAAPLARVLIEASAATLRMVRRRLTAT